MAELCVRLDLARSSYFYHRAHLQMGDKYAEVRRTITDIFERNHRCYGYRRIRASLARQHMVLSEKVVQRLMRQEHLVVAKRRRRYHSYQLGRDQPAPGKPSPSGLPRRSSKPEVAYGHHRVSPSRRQGLSLARHRLLRWVGRELVH